MKDYKDNLSLEHHVQMKHSQQSSDGNIQHWVGNCSVKTVVWELQRGEMRSEELMHEFAQTFTLTNEHSEKKNSSESARIDQINAL